MMSSRAFTAVRLPIMGGNSTPEELFNLSDLRVELLQSEARDLLSFVFNKKQQMPRYARHDTILIFISLQKKRVLANPRMKFGSLSIASD